MPDPQAIVAQLAQIAREAYPLAILWHVVLAAILVMLARGWRPLAPRSASVLGLPLLSVSVMAWRYGNPFNGSVFLLLAILAGAIGSRVPGGRVAFGPAWTSLAGGLMLTFGWVYPHFIDFGLPVAWLYASPVGLVPCPTLSALVGLSLLGGSFRSRAWGLLLGLAGAFYGLFGAFRLGVTIDLILLAGSFALVIAGLRVGRRT